MKNLLLLVLTLNIHSLTLSSQPIDRRALVERNNPVVTTIDTLASLSVGNGAFAFTTDITGLQTFPRLYANGIPLGTMSQWAWHSFPNTENYRHDETLRAYDFGRGHAEIYSTQIKDDDRAKGACNFFRANPHRLHLGTIGFDFDDTLGMTDIRQQLQLWQGAIESNFNYRDTAYSVITACHPERDAIAATIISKAHTPIIISLPYPTGNHTDDACNWDAPDKHQSAIIARTDTTALIAHRIDSTSYFIALHWSGKAEIIERAPHRFALLHRHDTLSLVCEFLDTAPDNNYNVPTARQTLLAAQTYWQQFWTNGAAVDFSHCTDPRAKELERRVVLSQYLLAIQCAADTPPQETGLTYNSWFGKFHLEMIWWHQAHYALWGHPEMLQRSLRWYAAAAPMARQIARRQGFDGLRWMKMTDPSAVEAPSSVGSFLVWQQPHIIYLAELLRRGGCDTDEFADLVDETARFMASFATYDTIGQRYVLRGVIPAQETLRAAETVNPPLELSYWHFGLTVARQWRLRRGLPRETSWDDIIDSLAPLVSTSADRMTKGVAMRQLYLAAETATDTYKDIRLTSDHPAVLGALGMLPANRLIDKNIMRNTLQWVYSNWNWDKTWGWDYPMTAMCAARLGERKMAVDALLMPQRTNTYLPNGHNYQDSRLRCYLPGNGGLLTAVAMMCAGWDEMKASTATPNPGFPDDGSWDVRWEGLLPLP